MRSVRALSITALTGVLLSGCISADLGAAESPDSGASQLPVGPPRFDLIFEQDCPDIDFECVRLAVPRDHFSDDATMWQVDFAIRRAEGDAKGTFVTITGGPGSSGRDSPLI